MRLWLLLIVALLLFPFFMFSSVPVSAQAAEWQLFATKNPYAVLLSCPFGKGSAHGRYPLGLTPQSSRSYQRRLSTPVLLGSPLPDHFDDVLFADALDGQPFEQS